MSLTKRQYNWLVNRIDRIAWETAYNNLGLDDCIIDFMASKVIRNCGTTTDLSCEWHKIYVFAYHDEPMFLELKHEVTFISWHIGYVSAWPYEEQRDKMMFCYNITRN